MESVDSDTDNKMSNKRKAVAEPEQDEETEDESEDESRAKRPRRRRRSCSEPRNTGSDTSEKREALRRLFGWYFLRDGTIHFDEGDDNYMSDNDENDDPFYVEDPLLLDSIPECMDPEQLGFLLCAQETLRYLRQTGMSVRHTVYMSLRNRFVKAIKDLGIA